MKNVKFKDWLADAKAAAQQPKYKKLVIFDFDGTLANTPTKPQAHEPKHGWKGKDWWGSPESLQPPFFNGELHDEVKQAFEAARRDPDTKTVLLTGRRGVVSPHVRNVLQTHGFFGKRMIPDSNKKAAQHHAGNEHPNESLPGSHEEFYSGDHSTEPDYPVYGKKPDGSTIAHKAYIIKNKLVHNNLEQLDIWEDRPDHINPLTRVLLELQKHYPMLQKVTLHRVYPEAGGHVQHIPIRPGMVY